MRNTVQMVNTQQAIAGRTTGRRTGTAGTRQGQHKGQSDGVDLGAREAVCDVVLTPRRQVLSSGLTGRTLSDDTPQKRIVTHTAAPGFTIGDRERLQGIIEADIHRTRKLGMMDFNRSRQAVRAAILALPFLDPAAVRRLTGSPLPTKPETISDLNDQLIFLSSDR